MNVWGEKYKKRPVRKIHHISLSKLIVTFLSLLICVLIWEVVFSNEIKVDNNLLKRLFPNLLNVRVINKNDLMKNNVIFEGSEDLESEEYGCSTYIIQDFNKDGIKNVAICGVYFNKKLNKEIPFLTIISIHGEKIQKDFVKDFNNFFYICRRSEKIKLQKNEVIRIAFKVHTDWAGGIFWEKNKYIFRYHPSP